jgi:hypothetical protein
MISNNGTNEISVTEGARRATGVTDISTQKTGIPKSEVRIPIKRPRHTENFKHEKVSSKKLVIDTNL